MEREPRPRRPGAGRCGHRTSGVARAAPSTHPRPTARPRGALAGVWSATLAARAPPAVARPPRPHSPVGAAPPPPPAQSSSAHSPQNRAGHSMQPLASEPGRAGAWAVSASFAPAPTSRLRRPGDRGPAQTGRAAPPTVAGNSSLQGAGRQRLLGLPGRGHLARPLCCHPPLQSPLSDQTQLPRPRRGPAQMPARPPPSFLAVVSAPADEVTDCRGVGGAQGCARLDTRAGSSRERTLASESGNRASKPWPLSPYFLGSDSTVSDTSPTSLGELESPNRGLGSTLFCEKDKRYI
jgi:hypothetical protein